jgi:hypothetical protein
MVSDFKIIQNIKKRLELMRLNEISAEYNDLKKLMKIKDR